MNREIRSVIADDEILAREKLRILLGQEEGVRVVGECRDGKEALTVLTEYKPDLLFLDIHMPVVDGFQVLQAIPEDDMPLIIFTTAYDQYAIRAFEQQVLDYLLKPFDQQRLHRAIQRTRAELLKVHGGPWARQMFDLFDRGTRAKSDRLVIRSGGQVVFLDGDEIAWIEAAGNYVKVHAGKQSYLVRDSIAHFSERLEANCFVRIHRSIIANVSSIKALRPCNSGEYIAILKDGKELPCSRSYRSNIQQLIGCEG